MSASLPRWLSPRAARLGAALVECLVEVHGHAGLLQRLSDARYLDAFARALGLGEVPARGLLAVLERGLRNDTVGDSARLGVVVSAASSRVSLVGRAGVVVPERAEAAPLEGEARCVVERRLGALLLASHGALPGPFAPLSRRPGVGPRAALALAVLSELVFVARPSPFLTELGLGSASGAPLPVPLLVYDEVIAALERMLHRPARDSERAGPLAALFFEVGRLSQDARPASLERVLARERRLAKELCGFTAAGPVIAGARAPALRRRLARQVGRDPRQWRPPALAPASEEAALEDLFLP